MQLGHGCATLRRCPDTNPVQQGVSLAKRAALRRLGFPAAPLINGGALWRN
jgi:hypothetical protein